MPMKCTKSVCKKTLPALAGIAALTAVAPAAFGAPFFIPGDLVVSRSDYLDTGLASNLVAGTSSLPDSANGTTPYTAIANGTYPTVFDNNTVDGSFGVTSPIFLDQLTPTGALVDTLNIPTSLITTSFSSKSELALNLSTTGDSLTFMGYAAPVGALDVSNSNTPGVTEPGNYVTPVTGTYREVAQVGFAGDVQVTTTNAYDGNNGRAAILDSADNQYLTVGNAGNGNGSAATTAATGVQIVTPGQDATSITPGTIKVGNFNVTQVGLPADKSAKDNNYRGETIFNNTLYVTKGSGSNGIDTVYQVGSAGALPTAGTAAGTAINVLPGLPIDSAKTNTADFYPFGIFFANPNTLYVADEGDGTLANASKDPNAGLEKWTKTNSTWNLDYTLQNGLNLGQTYTVPGYPTGNDVATGKPYAPATDGLRNLTGKVNADGTVSLYAVTSTVSGSGDQGADPNELVGITDNLAAISLPASEQFTILDSAQNGQVLRGVSFAPAAVPEPSPLALLALGVPGLAWLAARRRKTA